MSIKIPSENIFDKILRLQGKERKIIVPEEAAQIYKEKGPYVQIKGKRESFWKTLFQGKKHGD